MYIGKFGNLKLKVKSSTEIQHGTYIYVLMPRLAVACSYLMSEFMSSYAHLQFILAPNPRLFFFTEVQEESQNVAYFYSQLFKPTIIESDLSELQLTELPK